MTNDRLLQLLSFDGALQSVEIINEVEVGDGLFITAQLNYPDEQMTVPFVYFEGSEWIFTPSDWQGVLPQTPEDIDTITWRVNNTEQEGIILDGLPRLAPWAPEPEEDLKLLARREVGRQVREAREAAGLSLRALAEKAAISWNHISRIEQGRDNVTIDTLSIIAKALDTTITIG